MPPQAPPVVRLADYRPPNFLIDIVDLDIRLDPTATRVIATLALRPNPEGEAGAPLTLDGEDLKFVSASVDQRPLFAGAYDATPSAFILSTPPARPFTLTIETEINPSANTKLMGLYRSGSAYCTQCEADGFRRIAYFLDRPDVLSKYTTRIEADHDDAPVMLGNGNPRRDRISSRRKATLRGMARSLSEALLSLRARGRRSRQRLSDSTRLRRDAR